MLTVSTYGLLLHAEYSVGPHLVLITNLEVASGVLLPF